jgi:KDO2-lipid IV(A) lauroyltransferase
VSRPSDHWSFAQRRKNDVLFALVLASVWFARVWPVGALRAMGRALGWIAFASLGRERRRAVERLEAALELDRPTARRLARQTFVRAGDALASTLLLLRPRRSASERIAWAPGAKEALAAAVAEGRGVVLVTAHFGLWEHLAASIVEAGFRLVTPVRTSYDPRIEARVMRPLRADRGVVAIDRDAPECARTLLRSLRDGAIVGVLLDLNTRGDAVETRFFGRPAWTSTIAAQLAATTGAPVVTAFAHASGIEVEALGAEDARIVGGPARREWVIARTARLTAKIEQAIRRDPTAWIWMHDRWGARRSGGDKSDSPADTDAAFTGERSMR